jgi:vacuolar-type H+-ATPase subunit I/STV1
VMPNDAVPTPLFTADLTGLIKLLAVLVSVVLIPAATLIVVFLKRTDTARIQKQEDALNGLGERVNKVENTNTRLQEQYSTLQSQIAGTQRDILEAIRSTATAQIMAVHAIELQVERLKAQSDIGECLTQFSNSIERLIERIPVRGD